MRNFTRFLIAPFVFCLLAVPRDAFSQNPLIKLSFDETTGTPLNTGTVSSTFIRSSALPASSTNIPTQTGNVSSLDFGVTPGNYYIESSAVIPELKGLSNFTITGWVNAKSNIAGEGGNRIVSWINSGGDGVDLVMESDGRLRLGVNSWPDGSIAYSGVGRISIDAQGGANNWVFFAVSYAANTGEVKWYIGNNSKILKADGGAILQKGVVGSNIGKLAIGSFNSATRNPATYNRMFRGSIDDIRIYGSILTLDNLQTLFGFNQDTTPPEKIKDLHIVSSTPHTLTAAWTTPDNSGVVSYAFYTWDLTNNMETATSLDLVNTYTTIPNLIPGSTQRVQLIAFDAAGHEYSVEVITTLPFEPLPTDALVSVDFDAPNLTYSNAGSAATSFVRSAGYPTSNTNVPAGVGGSYSVDFGAAPGNYYVSSVSTVNELKNLDQFTITGWVNNKSSISGAGGNRIVSWINSGGDGVDLVYQSDGSLRLGVDQWPDYSPAFSSANKITTNAGAALTNWVFFAVTYSSVNGEVNFYFGDNANNAKLDVTKTYSGRGQTGSNIAKLAIGAFNDATRNSGTYDRMFRGMIDNVTVHGSVLSQAQVVEMQRRSAVDTTPPPAPINLVASDVTSSSLTLSWEMTDPSDISVYFVNGMVGTSPFGGSTSLTSMNYPGLFANTTYTFTVQAKDNAGNLSAPSNLITVKTLSGQQPLIKLALDEATGIMPANTGLLSSAFTRSAGVPVSTPLAPRGTGVSFGFGVDAGNYYVESAGVIDGLKNLNAFTITGWINNRTGVVGSGGNRIVSWINSGGDGVDLVYQSDGSLRLGVDQWPDYSPAVSSPAKVTTLNNTTLQSTNWVFFAVTYQANGQVEYYFGKPDALATLDVTRYYGGPGTTGSNISKLAIGNFNVATRNPGTYDRMFRGFIDEVQIFGSALALSDIVLVQGGSVSNYARANTSMNQSAELAETILPEHTEEETTQLSQNYPNPFATETTIEVYVPHTAKVARVVVTDVSGRALKNIEVIERGKASINIQRGDMNSGMYVYSLMVDGKTEGTKRMAIIK